MKNIITILALLLISISNVFSASYTVTKTADDLTSGTLRSAIISSNAAGGSNTITITTTGTITLTSALPVVTTPVVINCTDASGITISGNNLYRIFEVSIATGTVTFKNLNILNGKGDGGGGGIFAITSATGKIICENCSFTGCSAIGSQAYGGAIQSSADVDLLNCTLTGNSAIDGGGAIEILDALAVLTINHCTIYQNSTSSSNIAGGIDLYLGKLNMTNSIVANNTNGNASGARDVSKDAGNINTNLSNYNIYTTAPFSGANDLTNKTIGQIGVSALTNNGGKVKTMRIALSSIARNAGTGSIATDARELAREGIVDIGAFESLSPTATTNSATGITNTTAVLNGVLDNKGYTVSLVEFEYGNSTGNYAQTQTATLSGGTTASYSLTSQAPGSTVYYRLAITVDGYKFYGLEKTLTLLLPTDIDEQNSLKQLVYSQKSKQLSVNGLFDYVEVFDATGKLVQRTKSNSLNLNGQGMVIVRLHSNGKFTSQKIVL